MKRLRIAGLVWFWLGVLAVLEPLSVTGCGLFGPVAPAVVDLAARIIKDALAGMTFAQIAIDTGASLATIIETLLMSKDPSVRASVAFAEATQARAALVAMPAPDGGP